MISFSILLAGKICSSPGAAPVGDARWRPNWCGLDQMGYNISEMTLGHYHVPAGQYGSETDGASDF